MAKPPRLVRTWIVAVPETAGGALYGMVDVLLAAGSLWQALGGEPKTRKVFDVRIVSPSRAPASAATEFR